MPLARRFCLASFLLPLLPALASTQPPPPTDIVVGFVGGNVNSGNGLHAEVELARRLSDEHPNLYVRVFENHRGDRALEQVLHLLDTNRDGKLSAEEKAGARIVIYGHSWGASEAITLARSLGRNEIPVLLTIQVDSVRKPGEDDARIPANVRQAVNYYQLDGLLHGRSQIHAADASSTRILANLQFTYKTRRVVCNGFPWYAQLFMKPHIEIECDPVVWEKVDQLIRSQILP